MLTVQNIVIESCFYSSQSKLLLKEREYRICLQEIDRRLRCGNDHRRQRFIVRVFF